MNISWSLQYVKVLTSNQFAAPAGSQAAKPPFLLCIVDMNTVKYQGKKQATKKKRNINKVPSEWLSKGYES